MEWEKQTDGMMWPSETTKEGEFVEGKVLNIEEGKYKWMNYTIEKDDGSVVVVKGTKALEQKMVKVKVGSTIRIEYKGRKDVGKGNPMIVFDVFLAKGVVEPPAKVSTRQDHL